jgi:hypothetical protein
MSPSSPPAIAWKTLIRPCVGRSVLITTSRCRFRTGRGVGHLEGVAGPDENSGPLGYRCASRGNGRNIRERSWQP